MVSIERIREKLQAQQNAHVARCKAWSDHRLAKGLLGEALAERWMREDRGMSAFPLPQDRDSKFEICPPDGKRPDFLLDFEDVAVFADAKLHQTEGGTRFCLPETELSKYQAFLKAYDTEHLVFLVIPDVTRSSSYISSR